MKYASPTLLALALCIMLPAAAPAIDFSAERSPLEPTLHTRVVEVMHLYYNFEFDAALVEARAIRRDHPRDPVGHFLESEIFWWQAINKPEDRSLAVQFEAAAAQAIALSKERLEEDDRDPLALFFLGGAYGRQAILAGMESRHLDAVRTALDGRKYIKRLNKYHREIEDAYFGLGLYDYYAAELPWFARVMGRLFLGLAGDKERGLEELERAAKHGLFTQIEARIFLAIIYLDAEERPDDAIVILRELHERYPENLNFYGLLGFAYRTRGELASSLAMLEASVAKAATSTGYGRRSRSMAVYFLGSTYKLAGRFEEALARLDQAIEDESDQANNWLLVITLLERGRVHDLLGQREAALADYQRVLDIKEFRGSHGKAKELLETPYVAPEQQRQQYLAPDVEIALPSDDGSELPTGAGSGHGELTGDSRKTHAGNND